MQQRLTKFHVCILFIILRKSFSVTTKREREDSRAIKDSRASDNFSDWQVVNRDS